jgi:hypothetical protein
MFNRTRLVEALREVSFLPSWSMYSTNMK